MKKSKITVIGASNIDLIAYVPQLPKAGETLHGSKFLTGFGGKGANQAVMAAKLGAEVSMVTKLGDDTFGKDTIGNFHDFGINTKGVFFTDRASSGVAPIAVDSAGQNSIIVVPGANDLLSIDDLESAKDIITNSDIVICQLEIPVEISLAALKMAKEAGVTTIFNPAPAREKLPKEIYQVSDIFCPNETETEILTGLPVNTEEEAIKAANELLTYGAKSVILTLGQRGSLIVEKSGFEFVPATKVVAKDTTGAGDSFIGSLAFFLGSGNSIIDAMKKANIVAGISVQHLGTQTSYPLKEELPPEMFT
jgi:ribokinase